MPPRILVIDDDRQLGAMLGDYLGDAGFEVHTRDTRAAGLAALREPGGLPSLLVLDLMLPDGDGLALCRAIRSGEAGPAAATLPILMLTARGDDADRIVGLELGADDYLAKPFNPRELLARIRALLRRTGAGRSAASPSLRFGRLAIDPHARTVHLDGEPRTMTGHQFDLLLLLAEHAGRVMSRDAIQMHLRGHESGAFDRSIDVHVSRVRAAIEDDPARPRRILTVRGVGYVFASQQDREPDHEPGPDPAAREGGPA